MSDWKPDLYLKFEKQRTQPTIDLAARIEIGGICETAVPSRINKSERAATAESTQINIVERADSSMPMRINTAERVEAHSPMRIIDIGCGPGNSTAVLKKRWPDAAITGLDSSPAMIAQAAEQDAGIKWICADGSGDLSELGLFDIVFSNAAIQWMPDHAGLLARYFSILEKGGAMAVQVPNTTNMPIHHALLALAEDPKWRAKFGGIVRYSNFCTPYYYDILSKITSDFDLWETHYVHVMNGHAALVQMYSCTGMRPYLDRLESEGEKALFLAEFEEALKTAYLVQTDGNVLFPFARIFFVARKG